VVRRVRSGSVEREVNSLVCLYYFIGSEAFLRSFDRPTKSGLKRAFDPDLEIEVAPQLAFEQEDALDDDYLDVLDGVTVFPIFGCGLFRKVGSDIDRAVLLQGENEPFEHLVEPDRVAIEVAREIRAIEPGVRQIQPSVYVDDRRSQTGRTDLLIDQICNISFARCIDAGNTDEQGRITGLIRALLNNAAN
jgi:hypothetical protein